MASWEPSGSILEASGLHFGGSGPHFRRLWTSYLEPRTPRTPKNLQKQKLHHKVARPPKGGWAAVIPPGGFQWNCSQVGRFGIQRLLGSWQFAETVPSHRTPASGWAFPGLARFRPHFSSSFSGLRLRRETRDVRLGIQPDVRPSVRLEVRPDVRAARVSSAAPKKESFDRGGQTGPP